MKYKIYHTAGENWKSSTLSADSFKEEKDGFTFYKNEKFCSWFSKSRILNIETTGNSNCNCSCCK